MGGRTNMALSLQGVALRFRIPRERIRSVKEYAIRRLKRDLSYDDFWALRDLSMDVQQGEVFGVIGRNGAGKTCLLKVIARVLQPTAGRVVVRGRVAPLLGLGAGFNEELTGRENVFLNGTALGYSISDLRSRLERIVEFAELEEFIDAPLRTYSNGMRARLGFSIATDVMPDILLLDEIMSVGDTTFRKRSEERIAGIREKGATVIVVSHGLPTIASLCTRGLLLDRGRVVHVGPTEEIIQAYEERFGR